MSQVQEILLPEGRLVGGHPMIMNPVKDDHGKPKVGSDGQPMTQTYIGVAIRKGTETDWKQTEWGQKIQAAAMSGWPNGEFNAPAFAWKIDDGDSTIPNKRGIAPCSREGYPGHWIVKCSTSLPVKCFHAGRYEPINQIQDKNEIKPGDYCRVFLNAKANNPSQSPGVYLNPSLFELSRAGELIVLDGGPSAADVFGGGGAPAQSAPVQQPAAQPPAAGAPALQPARDFLQGPQPGAQPAPPAQPQQPAPEPKFRTPQGDFTRAQLQGYGWNDQQIDALPQA